ncbi:VWA containing CoxE family protein [Gilliamella sp. Fer2-1]|nr:VWA containing CoxE family protein [Gilliamella apicola]
MNNNKPIIDTQTVNHIKRWRLILGKYADHHLNQIAFDQNDLRLAQSLDFLYRHEYRQRGLNVDEQDHTKHKGKGGSNHHSVFNTINWLNKTRKLFPKSTFERMQQQAIERYQLHEILNDSSVINALEPNMNSLHLLMNFRGQLKKEVYLAVKELIQRVVDQILQKINPNFINAISGKKHRFRPSQIRCSQNFDWRATMKANLKHFDQNNQRLMIENVIFNSRMNRHLPWDIILCVDQSASMNNSIIYSAVCASILAKLPTINLHLFVFDTQIVDLTHLAHDPVEVLMSVQLGGGTNIAKVLNYAEQKVKTPHRTIMVLVSDFCEGGSLIELYTTVSRMNSNRIKMLGLAALDDNAEPVYDLQISQQLANRGMQIAALTPEHFATWLAEVM